MAERDEKKYNRLSLEEYLLLTLYELFQMWFDSKKRVLKPKSLDRIESTVNTHILPAIGEYRLCDITSDDIQTLVFDKMAEKNLSKSSIKKAYDDLKNFFNYCMDNDFIDRSPMRRVTINCYDLKCENKVKNFDHDEMEKIIASATELYSNGKPVYECGLIFPIMYYTGMRIGEALGLKYKYVNFDEGYIDIVETVVTAKDRKADGEKRRQIAQQGGKTKNSCRRIPLNSEAAKFLKMHKVKELFDKEKPCCMELNGKRYLTVDKKTADEKLGIDHRNIYSSLSANGFIFTRIENKKTRYSYRAKEKDEESGKYISKEYFAVRADKYEALIKGSEAS